jgi:hypothetical protein
VPKFFFEKEALEKIPKVCLTKWRKERTPLHHSFCAGAHKTQSDASRFGSEERRGVESARGNSHGKPDDEGSHGD